MNRQTGQHDSPSFSGQSRQSRPDARLSGGSQASRGQSEALGFVLIFGIMIAGALIIVGLGSVALSDTEEELGGDRAEKALTQFDSKAGLVALGEADSQRLTFPADSEGQYSVSEDSGWMNITVENRTTGDINEVMNTTLGSVEYEGERSRLAYQGGGVWRASETGGQMVSPPEFHYRNGTLTLPTVQVSGDSTLTSTVDVKQAGETQMFPDDSLGSEEWINPLDNHKVNLTVGSEFYQGWGHYFEERTDGDVIYEEDRDRVTLELVVEADNPPVEGGLITGTSEELTVKNNAQMDSYNSEEGSYSQTSGNSTRIVGSGDLSIEPNSKVWGSVEVDGDVTFENEAELEAGNISHGGTIGGDGWDEGWTRDDHHWVNDNASVRSPDSVELLIDERTSNIESSNDNNQTDDISENELDCSADCTIPAGEYYFEEFDLDGDLEFDTTDGEIDLAVSENIHVDGTVNVTGEHRTNIWANENAELEENAEVLISGDNSTQFWLYMNPDQTATLENNAQFTGVIYGPGNLEPGVEIELAQNVNVFGGTIGEVDFAANNVWVHYDEALAETESVTHDTSVVTITFLHVSVNEISVGSP